jgi:hypothetical protein
MKTISFFAITAFLCLFINLGNAQTSSGISSEGRDFYIAKVLPSFNKNPPTSGRNAGQFFSVSALITTAYDNSTVTISFFTPSGIEFIGKKIIVNHSAQINFDSLLRTMKEPGDIPEFNACHITSDYPINVVYFSYGACSGGSYLALPTNALGRKYVVATYFDNPGIGSGQISIGELAGGGALIISPFDNTTVTIIPNETTAGGHVGVHTGQGSYGKPKPYSITLMRGQCYLFKGKGADDADDMSGSTVESDKPIAVLGFHEDAILGDAPTSRVLEGRDFMIEQMMPAEFWDSTGYVSIPFPNVQPVDETSSGYGDSYRVFTNDSRGATVVLEDPNQGNSNNLTVGKYSYPTPERFNVADPVDLYSKDGHKFEVMMYDLREDGRSQPFPSENMMTIVPISRWKRSFFLYVPTNTYEVLQNYYFNIIAEKKDIDNGWIKFSVNGSPTLNRVSILIAKGSYTNIPNHPELKGARYGLSPGAYYFTNTRTTIDSTDPFDMKMKGAFMIYNYGMRALDPDRDLGDFDGDDFFFSYANPAGMSLSSGDPAKFGVTIDSQCTKWNICVTDHRKNDAGIRSIVLLNDSVGLQYSPGKKSSNVHFDTQFDPNGFGEIDLPGTDSTVCFSVSVTNPLISAYGAIMISDNAGNMQLIELKNEGLAVSAKPAIYPLNFGIHGKGSDTCIEVTFTNINSNLSALPVVISNASLTYNKQFQITSTRPTLPISLAAHDSLVIRLCFEGLDTSMVFDTLRLGADCFAKPFALIGQGTDPVILASDINFGEIDTGLTLCKLDTIRNIGTKDLILGKNFTISDSHFRISDSSRLPLTIAPGKFETLSVCYTPTSEASSGRIDWNTNERDHAQKDFSLLKGKGSTPSILWNVNSFTYYSDTINSVKNRFWLFNHSSKDVIVDLVDVAGGDFQQFTLIADQLGYIPLSKFPLKKGDSIWVDVRFNPILSGNPPARYADRHTQLVATATGEKSAVVNLTATFTQSSVELPAKSTSFSILPNPANGNSIVLSFDDQIENAGIKIFDVLGREILAKNISNQKRLEIPIRHLQNGIYYVRLDTGKKIRTEKFEVLH